LQRRTPFSSEPKLFVKLCGKSTVTGLKGNDVVNNVCPLLLERPEKNNSTSQRHKQKEDGGSDEKHTPH